MSLSEKLLAKRQQNNKRIPFYITNYMDSLSMKLKQSGAEKRALKKGDPFPNGVLMNHLGNEVILSDYLGHNRAIISFYRGAWCPYCNLELRAYNALLEDDENKDVNMIAISPEKPDQAIDTIDIDTLNLTVLSDVNNEFAKKIGLVFKTTALLRLLYRFDGINLNKSQGNQFGELPIPATYVIDSDGTITYAFIDADYTRRAEPTEVIAAYHSLRSDQP